MSSQQTVLVAGALGIVGRGAIEHFAGLDDWEVVGLSRRSPDFDSPARFVSVDLKDRDACLHELSKLRTVTHVVYAALHEEPDLVGGWRSADQMNTNLAMLTNLLDGLALGSPELQHISLLQGTKAYGHHIEPMRIPGRESSPRHPHENFYWLQEDLLRERQPRSGWQWTVLRPQVMFGWALRGQMNTLVAVGAVAALMKELERPMSYPGSGRAVKEATDARLLGAALHWAAVSPQCGNQIYNINNGDPFTWQDLWPEFADHYSVEIGEPEVAKLSVVMPKLADTWDRIAARHGLRYDLATLVGQAGWEFLDYIISDTGAGRWSSLVSTIKARQAGFSDCIDTAQSVHEWLDRLQRERILPPSS